MKRIVVGHGRRPALLVHGNDLCAEFYLPLAEQLAARGLVTTLVTLPGFHREPPLASPSWNELARLVVDALPGPDTTLIGHSMGGLVALLAAARRPPELGRVVLLEPAVFPTRRIASIAADRYRATVVHGDLDRFENWNGGMRRIARPERFPRERVELYLEVRRSSDRATVDELFRTLPDLYPLRFGEVRVPVQVVAGGRSGWRGSLMTRAVAHRLRARRTVVPDAAHWLANEQDAAVAGCIDRFVG